MKSSNLYDYSRTIAQCFSANIRYLSVTEDRLITSYSIKTVRETKEKKMLMSKPLEHSSKIGDESLRIDNDKSLPLELSTLKRKFMSSTSKQDLNFLENSPTNRPRPEFSERTYTLNLNSVTNESSPRIIPAGSIGSLVPIEIGSRGVSKKKGNGSPRGEFMRSTFGMSRASLLGTKQSDFFSDIDNDAELLQRFRDAQKSKHSVFRTKLSIFRTKDDGSNTARDDSQTSKIKFNGLRTQLKGFSGISKEHLLKAKKVSDLRQLADLFREKNMEDLKLLEGKTLELTQELNSITERNEKKQKVLYQLEETYERLLKETNDDASVVIPDVSQSVAKASNLEENYEALKNQENRLNQIIEICNVNKNQNDEWLRQLGFYSENLNKCIEEKRSQAKEVDREAGLADSNFSLLKDWFKSREANNQELITALDKIQTDNQVLQSQFMVTENLIQRSIEKTKRRLEERAEDRLKQLDENTKERAVSAKNRRIQKELNHKKETLQKYAQIFADGADGQHWTEKPEIKELLDNLAEKKELEKELMQLGFELKEKKMKNSELKRRIEVANQTKAINGHNRDLEDLRKEESRKKHQLEQEKEKIAALEEILKSLPKVTLEDNLFIINFANRIGITEANSKVSNVREALNNELFIKSIKERLYEIKDQIKAIVGEKDLEKLKNGDIALYTKLLKEGGKEVHKRKNRLLTLKPGSVAKLPPTPED